MVARQQLQIQNNRTVLRERGEQSTSHSHHELSTRMLSERNTHSQETLSIMWQNSHVEYWAIVVLQAGSLAHIQGRVNIQRA